MLASSSRWVGWLAVVVAGLILVACSSDEPQQARPEPQPLAAQTEAQPVQDQAQAQQEAAPSEQSPTGSEQQPEADAAVAQTEQTQDPQAESQESEQAAPPQQAESQKQAEEEATTEQTQPSPAKSSTLQGVRGIVDPSNSGWPREVEGLNGVVSIPAKPMRIITASVGHDEMALALVPNDRLVAVGSSTKNATYSNVAALVQEKAEITRDPEVIIAQSPDVVVTSPFFPVEAVDALQRAGIPVIQTELIQSPEARINNILLMGYIFGEEERALEFAAEVQARYQSLIAVTSAKSPRPSVLALTRYSDSLWVAGGNSTEGGVITALHELAEAAQAGLTIDRAAIPVFPECRAVCDAVGLDPLGLIASGALLAAVDPAAVDRAIARLRNAGIDAARIGRIVDRDAGMTLAADDAITPLPTFARDELARYLEST